METRRSASKPEHLAGSAKPKVNILLSTYNGERYLEAQLQSLFSQDYPQIAIYARDDGSSDGTVRILESYERQGKIHLQKGENLGFCASFFRLLKQTPDGDFWSFCDQDDIWKKDKVSRAVKRLRRQTDAESTPLLYYSCSRMIDAHGNSLGIQKPEPGSLCFRRAMTGTFGVGFSMVLNRPLREAMLRCDPAKVHSHDWLAGAIALGLGRVLVDGQVSAYYRRLDESVTRISFGRRAQWFWNMLRGDGDVKERNIEFARRFYDELPEESQKWARLFGQEGYSLKRALIKSFYPRRWRPSWSSEVAMRVLMMAGRV